jgi:uncharacterized protein YbcV (DUF1398 family)
MNLEIRKTAHECAIRSHEGSIAFPQVVAKLAAAGIERYHADFQAGVTTYYLPDGATHSEPLLAPEMEIAADFSAPSVAAAVKSVQRGEMNYQQFVARVMAAGCVGYTVFIAGRRVIYGGRNGDQQVELFPSANN